MIGAVAGIVGFILLLWGLIYVFEDEGDVVDLWDHLKGKRKDGKP